MITTLKKILDKANKGGYAVPAFNINNIETLNAVVETALLLRSPVIVQTSEGAVDYAGMDALGGAVHGAALCDARYKKVPIVFHLDHGKNVSLVERAIKSGWYTSVMIDGSAHPYKENIRITKKIVEMAHARGISVEAELGAIAGIEDFVSVQERDAHLTSPEEAAQFVKATGCDALAVAIGTAHGAFKFKGDTVLDIARLRQIKKLVRVPLVLHGASGVNPEWVAMLQTKCDMIGDCSRLAGAHGVSDTVIRQAVKAGINKVNIDTDLRIAFTAGVRQSIIDNLKEFDPRKILAPAKSLMAEVVKHKIILLGSKGKNS